MIFKNDNKIFSRINLANSFYERLKGLMFTKENEAGEGMLIEPCNSIHTFFMQFSLDVAFLNKQNKVIKIIRDIKPWRMTWIIWEARKVLEVPAGKLPVELQVGDQIKVKDV